MSGKVTFTMLKPDATAAGHTGKIIDKILEAGFTIKAMKWTQLSKEEASKFYEIHKEVSKNISKFRTGFSSPTLTRSAIQIPDGVG